MISKKLYRLWREASEAGLMIFPEEKRDWVDGDYELIDFAYSVAGDRHGHAIGFTGDLETFLTDWLAQERAQ